MTIHVNIGEAKTRLSELVAAALRGEEVVLQRAGKPQVKLVALDDASRTEREAIARRRVASIGFARAEAADADMSLEAIKVERRYSPWRREVHGLDP